MARRLSFMRSMDLYSENQLRDTRSDQQASKNLLGESNILAMTALGAAGKQQGGIDDHQIKFTKFDNHTPATDRQDMAFMSIAFCSPMMLLGLGATMAFMDNMRSGKQLDLDKSLCNQIRWQDRLDKERVVTMMFASGSLSAKLEPLRQTGFTPAERSTSSLRKKGADRDALAMLPSERPLIKMVEARRSWVKASKILKKKQALTDHLEKSRGNLSLKDASAITSQIEQLDRALKKLGC
jgi:hypothetical protein